MSIWNVSHTIGSFSLGFLAIAGVALFAFFAPTFGMDAAQAWRGNFIFPAVVAIVIAIFCWWAIRDTPESCGLPSVQEYRNDHKRDKDCHRERNVLRPVWQRPGDGGRGQYRAYQLRVVPHFQLYHLLLQI